MKHVYSNLESCSFHFTAGMSRQSGGNCLNSASMSDHRCPQIVISFKLLSGKVQVKDIFTLSFPVITWVLFGVISLWMDIITHVQCIWEA